MIKKIYIYRFLALVLSFNNLLIFSNAHSMEIPDRYQTLEGEYITIEDSIEDKLYEIEIFGNTVQDENNLEDIQSVGDLYVDENGNPILDSQGREQYKIDIISADTNLLEIDDYDIFDNTIKRVSKNNSVSISTTNLSSYSGFYLSNGEYVRSIIANFPSEAKDRVLLDNISGEFTLSLDVKNSNMSRITTLYVLHDNNKLSGFSNFQYCKDGNFSVTFNVENKIHDIMFTFWYDSYDASVDINNIRLEKREPREASDYREYKKNTILLPVQLQKLGNATDRLYWDNEKKRYVIEKNVAEYIFTGEENISVISGWSSNNSTPFNVYVPSTVEFKVNDTGHPTYDYKVIVDGFKGKLHGEIVNDDNGGYSVGYTQNNIRLRIPGAISANTCCNYIKGRKLFYPIKTPLFIETNITSELKIPTYQGKTYIYAETENGIIPYLKVTVDRLFEVAKSAIEEAKLNPTIENISLSRMYINMLSESIHKDQLQEELNYIFNTDIKLDKKTISSSVDVYIKFDNSISMALSTNSITFEDLSGVDDVEMQNAVEILVSSSLPYQLNAYLMDEIYNSNKTKKIDIDRLEIKDSKDIDYKPFVSINNKVVLEDNCESGNNLSHNIDLKLYGSNAYQSDIYKTVIKFEAEQK